MAQSWLALLSLSFSLPHTAATTTLTPRDDDGSAAGRAGTGCPPLAAAGTDSQKVKAAGATAAGEVAGAVGHHLLSARMHRALLVRRAATAQVVALRNEETDRRPASGWTHLRNATTTTTFQPQHCSDIRRLDAVLGDAARPLLMIRGREC